MPLLPLLLLLPLFIPESGNGSSSSAAKYTMAGGKLVVAEVVAAAAAAAAVATAPLFTLLRRPRTGGALLAASAAAHAAVSFGEGAVTHASEMARPRSTSVPSHEVEKLPPSLLELLLELLPWLLPLLVEEKEAARDKRASGSYAKRYTWYMCVNGQCNATRLPSGDARTAGATDSWRFESGGENGAAGKGTGARQAGGAWVNQGGAPRRGTSSRMGATSRSQAPLPQLSRLFLRLMPVAVSPLLVAVVLSPCFSCASWRGSTPG